MPLILKVKVKVKKLTYVHYLKWEISVDTSKQYIFLKIFKYISNIWKLLKITMSKKYDSQIKYW